jgi:hypothetical protein
VREKDRAMVNCDLSNWGLSSPILDLELEFVPYFERNSEYIYRGRAIWVALNCC